MHLQLGLPDVGRAWGKSFLALETGLLSDPIVPLTEIARAFPTQTRLLLPGAEVIMAHQVCVHFEVVRLLDSVLTANRKAVLLDVTVFPKFARGKADLVTFEILVRFPG